MILETMLQAVCLGQLLYFALIPIKYERLGMMSKEEKTKHSTISLYGKFKTKF
jgi:hypothetical protein